MPGYARREPRFVWAVHLMVLTANHGNRYVHYMGQSLDEKQLSPRSGSMSLTHPISNQPVGLGFPHLAGRYRPGGSAFSSPDSWSYRDMERF